MKTTILLGAAMLLPLAAWGADVTPFDAKLGLWETTVKTDMPGMPGMSAMPQIPPEALARMSPEQRTQMEAMMKSRGQGGGITTKSCVTRDSLNRGLGLGERDSCTHTMVSSSASKQVMHVECAQGENKTSGDVTIERVDAEHVKGNMAMKGSGEGHSMQMTMSFDSKWVSADCGSVKPAGAK